MKTALSLLFAVLCGCSTTIDLDTATYADDHAGHARHVTAPIDEEDHAVLVGVLSQEGYVLDDGGLMLDHEEYLRLSDLVGEREDGSAILPQPPAPDMSSSDAEGDAIAAGTVVITVTCTKTVTTTTTNGTTVTTTTRTCDVDIDW